MKEKFEDISTEIYEKVYNMKEIETVELDKVMELYLTGYKLIEIPSKVLECNKLVELSFEKNHLDFKPQETPILSKISENFKKLKILNVNENYIEEIPDELSKLSNLKVFKANKNRIALIKLIKHESLKELYLEENEITEMNTILPNLINLQLSKNKITKFPMLMTRKLGKLNLSNNQIKKVEYLKLLKSLEVLDLSNNCIIEIEDDLNQLFLLKSLNCIFLLNNEIKCRIMI
jgi:Leucine-rich repeat (LRR) protein